LRNPGRLFRKPLRRNPGMQRPGISGEKYFSKPVRKKQPCTHLKKQPDKNRIFQMPGMKKEGFFLSLTIRRVRKTLLRSQLLCGRAREPKQRLKQPS
jgi:hypothetical protein